MLMILIIYSRRDRIRAQERRRDGSRDGVIELARLAGSITTMSDDVEEKKPKKTSKAAMTMDPFYGERIVHEENCYCVQPVVPCPIQKYSTEMGTTTDVTQELLRQINCAVPNCMAEPIRPSVSSPPKRRHRKRKESYEPPKNQPICSDLRIAELGVSTEIANMALRKNSEVPVIIKSNSRLKGRSYSLAVLNQESDVSRNASEWVNTPCSTVDESAATKIMDRRLGSLIKLPLRFFKKNILTRSSRISIPRSSDRYKSNTLRRRLKQILYEEVTEHQIRGIKRLYSTINRRNKPYKLGWIDLVAKVSKIARDDNTNNSVCICSKQNGCKHFRNSHSYRCMRAQVMKLAGPTRSQLACYRKKIKNIIAPPFLRNILMSILSFLFIDKEYPAIKFSQACGRSDIEKK
ncbi:unnamed protein product [Spodoptera littoralis]|uniref:Uncharacterized protein n=1 Tax=Spodoptera littoralis TaxID=7109 RepID=A0A9P0N5K0_SPOLI|nr:unnamed protein product [Spodoptera littoralis]CAH1642333.1 unnamed protein product [Spodoptera littoralis]